MIDLLRMFGLIILLISIGIIYSFNEYKNYNIKNENVHYSESKFFNETLIIDSLIKGKILNNYIKNNDFQKVEHEIKKINSIESVDIYHNSNLELGLNVTYKKPVAFSIFYDAFIDVNGGIISRKTKFKDSLPRINGMISTDKIPNVLRIISVFKKNEIFKNRLDLVWFDKEQLFIKVKNLDYKIRLGNDNKLKHKLKMLEAFHLYQMSDYNQIKYKQIDLVYEDRLVAIKK